MDHFLTKDMIADFIPNNTLRRLYTTSQISRNLIAKCAAFFAMTYISLFKSFSKVPTDPKIGIIGLGHVGSTILQELQRLNAVPIGNLLVSTRCPERHQDYIDAGIQVFWNNEKLVTECDFVILSCLPHQIETVCANTRAALAGKTQGIFSFTEEERTPGTLVFSVLSGTPQPKLVQLLDNYPLVIRLNLDIDFINITIDQTGEEELPLINCLRILHEIIIGSVQYEEVVSVFNKVFTGAEEISDKVKAQFYADCERPADRLEALLDSYKIVENS